MTFNGHISAVVYKAYVRACLILRAFITRDAFVLMNAFIIYIRPLLLYSISISITLPHAVSNINREQSKHVHALLHDTPNFIIYRCISMKLYDT